MNRSILLAACALAVFTAPVAAQQADPHAGHQADPHAGHQMDHSQHGQHGQPQPDPHAGHGAQAAGAHDAHQGHGAPAQDPHAGHHMPAAADLPPLGAPPPEALTGPEHAADTVWNPELMAQKRQSEVIQAHGDITTTQVEISRLEVQSRSGQDSYVWDGSIRWGGDFDALVFKAEGGGGFGGAVESADFRLLWSHAIGPWFDVRTGVRYDLRPKPQRAHLVLGLDGTTPFWIDLETNLFLSDKGDLTGELEATHDMRLTNRLILQPRTEISFSVQDVPELGLGSGLSAIEAGARLRYEFVPEFAPYVGVEYARLFGDTRRFGRASGEDLGGWAFVFGVRTWF